MTSEAGSSIRSSAPKAAPAQAPTASTSAIPRRRKFLIGDIVHHRREGFLRGAFLAACLLAASPALADELTVGALRDQDGAIVPGAAVTALDARGAVLARDRSAADGTFAVATPTRPAAIQVQADDAETLRLAVPADGSPLAVIVRRHRSADRLPSAADVAALPAGSLSGIAAAVPYRVAFPNAISDRWLSRGRGVTTIERLPFYRRTDGADGTSLLPAHAAGAIDVHGPLEAPFYGDRALGGVVDARLFDRADTARATNRDAALIAGRDPIVLAAASWDPDGERRLAAARANGQLGPFAATAVALIGDAPRTSYAGAAADLRAATQLRDLGAHVALTIDRSRESSGTRDVGNVADAAFDVAGRGPNAIAVHARWREERGSLGVIDSVHHDAALVLGTSRGNVVRVDAALAFAYGDEENYPSGYRVGYALLPALSIEAPIDPRWTFHAGASEGSLGTPGYAIARGSVAEAGFAYTDRRRLRAAVVAYSEGDGAPVAVNRGFAASLGWEIAPRVSLRAWTLRDGEDVEARAPIYPGGPLQTVAIGRPFRRDLVWLTWDAPVRFDVLVRAGALEGGVRIPLAPHYALNAGAYRAPTGVRVFSLGLSAR